MGWEEREFDLGDLATDTLVGSAGGMVGGAGFFGVGKALGPVWNRIVSYRVGSSFDDVLDAGSGVVDDVLGAACSFSGSTLVLMTDGSRKQIEDVEVGDKVLATAPEIGETGAREVTHLWAHDDTLIDLVVDGDVITTTEDHPFWNETDGEWQRADQLDHGDFVHSADGDLLEVQGLDQSSTRTATAYNLTVDDIHTYYVAAGDNSVLVHNTCGATPRAGLGVNDPPARVQGPWTEADLKRGLTGRPPRSLASPELHHADQMPGAGIHKVHPGPHRAPGVHPNPWNQGVTDAMRASDRQLHWWYRAQEQGALERLGPEAIYDNGPG